MARPRLFARGSFTQDCQAIRQQMGAYKLPRSRAPAIIQKLVIASTQKSETGAKDRDAVPISITFARAFAHRAAQKQKRAGGKDRVDVCMQRFGPAPNDAPIAGKPI